jgi:predicted transglutaminase-like cysteine proteinase
MRPATLILLASYLATLIPILPSLAVEQSSNPAYMPLGHALVAPFSFYKFCDRKPTRCAPSQEVRQIPLDTENRKRLEEVQRGVNRSLSGLEKWNDDATKNDCTDYALTKRSRLLDMGFPSSALLIAVAYVPSEEAHLLLVVVTDRGDFVLDNLRGTVVHWDQLPYRWVMRSTPQDPKKWRAILPLVTGPGFEKYESSLAICQ